MQRPRSSETALASRANPAAVVWKELHDYARQTLQAKVPAAVTDMSGAGFARGLEHTGSLQVLEHAKYQRLLVACAQALRAGFELGFAEIGGEVTRAYADLDIRGAVCVTEAELKEVAVVMTEVLMECYPEHGVADGDPCARERAFRVVLLAAPSRHLGQNAGWKQGLHLVWPGVPVVREELLLVRDVWVKALDARFPRGGLKNYWSDVVDVNVYLKGGGLRFPHSSKFEKCRTCHGVDAAECLTCRGASKMSVGRAYSVTEVLLPDGIRDAKELARLRGSLEDEMLTCTIRTGLSPKSPGVARLEPPSGARPLKELLEEARGRRSGVPPRLRRFAKWEGVDPDAPAYRAVLTAARRSHPAFSSAQLSRVAISPNQKELVAISLDMRFCPNIRREHNSRTIFWVASLAKTGILTRCTCECPGRCKDWAGTWTRLDGGSLAAMFPEAADKVLEFDLGLTSGAPAWAATVKSGAKVPDSSFWASPLTRPGGGRRAKGRYDPSKMVHDAMTAGRSRAQRIIYGRHPTLVGEMPDRWNPAAGIVSSSPTGLPKRALSRASSVGSSSVGSGAGSRSLRSPRAAGVKAPLIEPPFELAPDMSWAELGGKRVELSPDQREALELVLTGNSVFITGPAGCGKSTLVPIVLRAVRQRLGLAPEAVAVTASTGIAAVRLRLNARTIYSYFGISPKAVQAAQRRPDTVEALTPAMAMAASAYSTIERQNALRALRVLFVDEVSMLSADVIEAVSIVLRRAQSDPKRAALPFGGVQVIFVGDFFQLAPVSGERDREAIAEARRKGREEPDLLRLRFAFQSPVWVAAVRYVVNLSTNFRQGGASADWRAALLRMRAGRLSDKDVEQLETHMPGPREPPRVPTPGWGGTVLVGTNVAAEGHHSRAMAALDGPSLTIHATPGIASFDTMGDRPASSSAASTASEGSESADAVRSSVLAAVGKSGNMPLRGPQRELLRLCKNVLAPDKLTLRRGMNLMCLTNLDTDAGLCNGTLLRVVDLEVRRAPSGGGGGSGSGSGWCSIRGDTVVRAGGAAVHRMRQVAWASSARDLTTEALLGVRVTAEYKYQGETRRVVVPLHCWSQRTRDRLAVAYMWQLPLRMSDAITVHKSQGMTLDTVALDLRGATQHGLGYTAISRARDWTGVSLLTRFDPRRAFRVHPDVAQWAAALDPLGEASLRCRGPVFVADRGSLSAELAAACLRMEGLRAHTRAHAAEHMRHTAVTDEREAGEVWKAWFAFEKAASTAVAPSAGASKRPAARSWKTNGTYRRARL